MTTEQAAHIIDTMPADTTLTQALIRLQDEADTERERQWRSVGADLLTAKLTLEYHINGAANADLPAAAQMIDRAIDTLATIQEELIR